MEVVPHPKMDLVLVDGLFRFLVAVMLREDSRTCAAVIISGGNVSPEEIQKLTGGIEFSKTPCFVVETILNIRARIKHEIADM